MSAGQSPGKAVLTAEARTPQHVVYRAFANETVLLNLDSGKYFGLNPTAGAMLEEVVQADTVSEAAERLAQRYGKPVDEISKDLSAFCVDLEQRGLLELRARDAA